MNIEAYLKSLKAEVDQGLENCFSGRTDWPPRLREAMVYSFKAGGKRIRPILAIAACEACGGEKKAVMPVALSLEMIHTFSLIHDDLPAMDDDDLRRGFPTNHKMFGEGIAILAGDALLSEAFSLLAQETDNREVIRDIAWGTGPAGMVGGQVLDLEGEGKNLTPGDLEKIHRNKTGRLIAVSVTSGAKIAHAKPSEVSALQSYGEKIGLAFQIADDILNVEGSLEKMGKSIGSDRDNRKATYPALLGLEASKAKAKETVTEAIACLEPFGIKARRLSEIAEYIVLRNN